MVALESFYFYIIFLHTPLNETVYQKLKPDFPASCVQLTPKARSVELAPTRDYFDVKMPDVDRNLVPYLDGYDRYLSPRAKGADNLKPSRP